MSSDLKGLVNFKIRSRSMPLINPSNVVSLAQRLKIQRGKMKEQMDQQWQQSHQVVDIENLKNKEIQQINTKIKVLAERSMKKLEEKYETIDRWKQKYVPESSIILIKSKLSLDNHSFKINMEEKELPFIHEEVSQGDYNHENLFPKIIKQQKTPTQSNHKEQGKRLDEVLRERLDKNKRYYELKSSILEKQINYFEDMNIFLSPDKKRELELRKLLLKSQKERAMFNKKLLLAQPLKRIKQQRKTRNIQRLGVVPKDNTLENEKQLKNASLDIYDLKAKLMEEVVGITPEGWSTLNQLDSPQDEFLS